MQTFLPYADFELSAQLLDKQRCWKQVVEAHQLLNVLLGRNDKKGWANHPATRMWYNYESALQAYYNTFFDFCIYVHNVKPNKLSREKIVSPVVMPRWFGYPPLHLSHKCNLVRKALDDRDGINAMGGYKNPKTELYDRVESHGLADLDPTVEYIWPVDKDGSLLPEIADWCLGVQSNA